MMQRFSVVGIRYRCGEAAVREGWPQEAEVGSSNEFLEIQWCIEKVELSPGRKIGAFFGGGSQSRVHIVLHSDDIDWSSCYLGSLACVYV